MQTPHKRVKAVIAYDGSAYNGFQKQKSTKKTITFAIEEALRSLHIDSSIVGSGRTDAGVHASGQVIHFDLPHFWSNMEKLQNALNRKLQDIRFKHISEVEKGFHARFSAKKRIYRYIFKTVQPSVFEQKYISYYPKFDTKLLIEALHLFEGEHDFGYFHKTGSVTHTTKREIFKTKYRYSGGYNYIYFEANGFLRAQVRMMTEAAMQYAQGQLDLNSIKEQLECKQKHITKAAPPYGLYLARIIY